MPASQSQVQSARDIRLPGEDLTIEETLRVMDVAREMRDQRQTAEEMFQRDGVRQQLREKLVRQAELLGENVSEAEIDAAIDRYLSNLHTYQDPRPGLKSFMAHCWVWRKRIFVSVAAIAIAASSLWFLFASPRAPLSPSLRAERAVAAEVDQAANVAEQIKVVTNNPEIIARAESLQAQAQASTDVTAAIAAKTQLQEMFQQLNAEYEVHVVAGMKEMSGFDRSLADGTPLYYAVVQARTADGKVVPQRIRNSETDRVEKVTAWAVQISESAFERLGRDKSDGVLNETLYSVKQRGELTAEIQMDGAVTQSPSTLTSWTFD